LISAAGESKLQREISWQHVISEYPLPAAGIYEEEEYKAVGYPLA
jgi:hypothetical protein